MNERRIEPARGEDLDAIRALLGKAELPAHDVDLALLAGFLVARDAGGLAGVIGLQRVGDAGLLRSLAVEPRARKLGVGGQLVDAVEAVAWAERIGAIYLLTTSVAAYFGARGYVQTGRHLAPEGIRSTAQFTGLCPASAAFMAKFRPAVRPDIVI